MNRVLIVDDKEQNLDLLRALMQGGGWIVDEARNGSEALTRASQAPPDLIVSDLLMPVMDGYTLLRQWKADERLQTIPFVVYTAAYTEPNDERLALELGADAFIVKSVEPELFMERIQEVVKKKIPGELPQPRTPEGSESGLLKEYSEVLIHKLEEKISLLEQANRSLRQEIARHQQVETELLQARQDWKNIFQATGNCILVLDLESKIIDANNKCIELVGKPLEDLLNSRCYEVFHAHGTRPADCPLEVLLRSGSTESIEMEMEVFGGSYLVTCTPVRDQEGEIRKFVHAATDITHCKKAESALHESEQRHRSLIEHLPQRIFVKDLNSVYVSCNRNFARDLGISQDQIVGMDDFAFFPQDLAQAYRADDQACMNTGMVKDLEEPYRLGGQDRWAHTIKVPYRDAQGQLIGVLGIFEDITERKNAEDAVRESETRYRTLFEDSKDGVYIVRREGEIIDANQSFLDIFGYSREEIIGLNIVSLYVDPEDRLKFVEALERANSVKDYEVRFKKKDGTTIECLLTSTVGRDKEGAIERYQGIIRDVTVQNQMKLTLEFERQQLLSIFDSINQIIVVIDPDTYEVLYANKHSQEFFQRDLVGGLCYEQLQDLEFPCEWCPNEKVRQLNGQAFQWELHLAKSDTDVVIIDRIIRWPDGRDAKFELAIDVTEMKRTEKALRESEKRSRYLAEVIENGPQPFGTGYPDGRLGFVNKAFCELTGYSEEELRQVDWNLTLTPPEWRALETLRLTELLRTRIPVRYEKEYIRKDGTRIPIELLVQVTQDQEGNPLYFQAFLTDLTDQKKLQNQLTQAQKMEAIGTLAGGIAHDFNNLLTVMVGYSEMILRSKDPNDSWYPAIQQIHKASQRGADLVQSLLAFSRKTPTDLNPLNLNNEVHDIAKLLARAIPKMVEIKLRLTDGLPDIMGDSGKIGQLIMNLGINASHAMPDGGQLVIETQDVLLDEEFCRSRIDCTPGSFVLMTVSDTGCGMDKETLQHIFEPFFTTKKEGKGTGLGLATCYGIVRQHGGFITCESGLGRGTTFRIHFPAIGKSGEGDAAIPQTSTVKGGSETILVVDDEDLLWNLAKTMLESAGYTVLVAENGQEALEVYKNFGKKISLVILDLMMPVMGGKACLQELLKMAPDVKVLIGSGLSDEDELKGVVEIGARGVVSKPYHVKELLEAIREILDE
jgi:PAS domain S-box-containing protein